MTTRAITGLIVAKWAEYVGIDAAAAVRMVQGGTPEFRAMVLDTVAMNERMKQTDRYLECPEEIAIDRLSEQLDAERAAKPGKRSRGLGEEPDESLPKGNYSSLYTPAEIAEISSRSINYR